MRKVLLSISTKLTVTSAILMILALLMVACGGDDSGDETTTEEESTVVEGDAVAGEATFQSTCAACHGQDAQGLPNLGKDMTISTFIKDSTDAELLAFVKAGRPISDPANTTGVDMPPKGGNPALTDEDILNTIAYIRSLSE